VFEPRGMEKTIQNGPTDQLRVHPVRRRPNQKKPPKLLKPYVQPNIDRLFERRPIGTDTEYVLAVRGTVHTDVG